MECWDWVSMALKRLLQQNAGPSTYIPGSHLPPKKGDDHVFLESSRLLTHVSIASEPGRKT